MHLSESLHTLVLQATCGRNKYTALHLGPDKVFLQKISETEIKCTVWLSYCTMQGPKASIFQVFSFVRFQTLFPLFISASPFCTHCTRCDSQAESDSSVVFNSLCCDRTDVEWVRVALFELPHSKYALAFFRDMW